MLPRIVPVMIIESNKAYQTVNFELNQYLGDPISIARLYGELGADELVIFDKSIEQPIFLNNRLRNICQEVYIPVAYGGHINSINDADVVMSQGIEKVVIKLDSEDRFKLVALIASKYGKQSVVGCINYISDSRFKSDTSYSVNHDNLDSLYAKGITAGVGELLIQDISRSGTKLGFNLDGVSRIFKESKIPIIYAGGANDLASLRQPLLLGASGVAASTIFSLSSLGNSPLISYITHKERSVCEEFGNTAESP